MLEMAWIDRYAVPKSSHNLFSVSVAQKTPGTHIILYKKLLDIENFMLPKSEQMTRSTIVYLALGYPRPQPLRS